MVFVEIIEMILPDLWFAMLGFLLFMFVALDGYDLGIGMLTLLPWEEEKRSIMIGTISYGWHANFTWLVILGGALFGVFPLAYGVVLSALYIPVLLTIFALIFRGVAIDFHEEAARKSPWTLLFGLGSLGASLAQGFVVGGFVSGFRLQGTVFAGSVVDWINPFSALIALAVVAADFLLGATFLILKTVGELREKSYRYAYISAFFLLLFSVGVGLWAWTHDYYLTTKWFTWPGLWATTLPTFLASLAFAAVLVSLRRRHDNGPFFLTALLLFLIYFATAASIFPYVIPPGVTITAAAAPILTLNVMAIFFTIAVPIILLYNGYQHLVFRGKTTESSETGT